MKTLTLLRHATAVQNVQMEDIDRELAPQAEDEVASIINQWENKDKIERVLCSTAKRTRQTYEMIRMFLPAEHKAIFLPELYNAGAQHMRDFIAIEGEGAEHILTIGHNPGIHQLALKLSHNARAIERGYPPAALTILEFKGSNWGELNRPNCHLLQFIEPHL
ncbi:MAG: histidine phosphatase family protein [Dongiaceae bacterium]